MRFEVKKFSELTTKEVYTILQLRSEIFVVEQNCVYQDIDGKDEFAFHIIGTNDNKIMAYARIFEPGKYFKETSIGRVVVSSNLRGKSFGKKLMEAAISFCTNKLNSHEIVIYAQHYLGKFYSELGFVSEGEIYLEDNIPHVKMRYTAKQI
jgi:ElaA protein